MTNFNMASEIMEFKKGDIIRGTHRQKEKACHPIVYIEGNLEEDFVGVMLTSSEEWKDNIPMLKEHFVEKDLNGKQFPIYFKDTYFVKVQLKKRAEWGPFTKAGELTETGIKFIEDKIKSLEPLYWEEYLSESTISKPK